MERMTSKEMLEKAASLLGLNQRELGIYIGVSTRTINSWMTGERECPAYVAEMALRLAQVDAKALEADKPTTDMYRWAVISANENVEMMETYGSKAEAMRAGEEEWTRMHPTDKKRRIKHEVGLIHCQLVALEPYSGLFSYYCDIDDHVDGDVYEEGKRWK